MRLSYQHFFIALSLLATGCAEQSATQHIAIQNPPDLHTGFITPDNKPQRGETTPPQTASITPATPPVSQSLWQRLISLYALPDIQHSRIDQHLQWYLKHPTYLTRIQQRAEPYLYYIIEEIEKQQVPGELALLPAVESAFKPEAYSSSHAAGLWQFIPSTGRHFGLKQTKWYDGRRDIIASTQAAVRYLKQLSQEFEGDWLLALASYNAGKGNIRKAMRKNRQRHLPTDYWALKLRRETMDYVPRLLAIAKIFSNPEKYNITLNEIPDKPHFEVVELNSQIDITKAAELAQLPLDDFLKLNPAFNRWVTSPDGPHRLLVPTHKASQFKERLAALPKKHRLKWVHHTIERGENLGLLARKYKTSVTAIKQHNHLKTQTLHPGQQLLIPLSDRPRHLASASRSVFYTVKKGDSLWKIARTFSVRQKDLLKWNRISRKRPLRPGQRLRIQLTKRRQKLDYIVKKGDSLFLISKKFNVSVSSLKKWNQQKNIHVIHPGQKLTVMLKNSPAT